MLVQPASRRREIEAMDADCFVVRQNEETGALLEDSAARVGSAPLVSRHESARVTVSCGVVDGISREWKVLCCGEVHFHPDESASRSLLVNGLQVRGRLHQPRGQVDSVHTGSGYPGGEAGIALD